MEKQVKRFSKKPMLAISIVVAIITVIALTISFAAETVKVAVLKTPNIDIALARSRTSVDVSNFKQDLLAKLSEKGVDTDKVNIIDVESAEVDMQTSFSWSSNVNPSIGSISVGNNGRDVVMYGNTAYAGKNAIFINSNTNGDEQFTFDYDINFGDSFNAAGMLLNVQQTNETTLEGYMLSFNNDAWRSYCGGYNGAIWKFTYVLDSNWTNFSSTMSLVSGLNIATSGSLSVTTSDAVIEITGGGLTNKKVKLPTIYGKGFGFFSDHYSHGCSNIGYFSLKNIKLNIINYKKISETLREPNWTPNSVRLMVNVDDYAYENFEDNSYISEIITRAMNNDLYYLAWGTDKNKTDAEKLIESIDGKGTYVDNTDYSKAIDDTAQYIFELLGGEDVGNTFCLGESIDLNVSPEDIKTNTADSSWPNGRWKVEHEYDYYENNNGQYDKTGVYTSDLDVNFDKVGKYTITYEDNAIVPKEIFVHRKPNASFSIKRTGNIMDPDTNEVKANNIELTSNSYDLDTLSNNNGIQEEEWSYKKVGDTDWTLGKISIADVAETYIVRLRVKDFQDQWSDYATKYISNDSTTPVAEFAIKNNEITEYEQLEVLDNSYDPAGKKLSTYNWVVKKGNENVYMGDTPRLDYKDLGIGEYTMQLIVTNEDNTQSEPFTQKFNVVADTMPPEVVADPTADSSDNKPITTHLTFTDQGGSGFAYFKYAISDSPNANSSTLDWSGKIRSDEYDITMQNVGENYIYVKSVDNAENESQVRVLGAYSIEQTTFKLNIQLADFSNSNILLGDAKFTLIEPKKGILTERKSLEGTTDNKGMLTFNADAMDAGTYDYILYETDAPSGYESIALGAVRITFDDEGNIIKVEKVIYSSDLLEIKDDYSATEMNLLIKNKSLESLEDKTNLPKLNIVVSDSQDSSKKLSGAIYSVSTESDTKNWSITNVATDAYGQIAIPVQGDGNVRITITENQPTAGYKEDSQEKVIVVNINNSTVQYLITKDPDKLATAISAGDNAITVNLSSEKKESTNVIKAKVVDKNDLNVGLTGISYQMTLPDNTVRTVETDDEGYAIFTDIPQDLGDGIKIFTLKQKTSIYGYLNAQDVSIKVTFKDGYITEVEGIDNNNLVEAKYATQEDETKVNNTAIATIGLEVDTDVELYNFVLAVEEKDSPNVVAGARYKITVQCNDSIKTSIALTNKAGEINVNVPVATDVRIFVDEILAPVGYAPFKGQQAIQLAENTQGKLEVVTTSNVEEAPYINEATKTIKLFTTNEKRSLSSLSKLSLYISKLDEYDSKIQNLKIKVSSDLLDGSQIYTTDKTGKVNIKGLEPPSEGDYDFTIMELNEDNTDNTDSLIKIRIKYEYQEGFLQVTGIKVLQGNKYVKTKEYTNYQDIQDYQSDVQITTYAKGELDAADGGLDITRIDFMKLDKQGKKINGAVYSLKVTRPNGTVVIKDDLKVVNDAGEIELPSIYVPNGSLIEFNETKAPIGYALDKNTMSYKVSIDAVTHEMTLEQQESQPAAGTTDKDETGAAGSQTAKVETSQVELKDGIHRYDISIVVTDNVLAPKYTLNIQKTTTNNLFTQEAAATYNIIINEDGKEKINGDYTTDDKGLVSFKDLNGVGTITGFINEPEKDPIRFEIVRSANDYKFTILADPTTAVDPNNPTITRKISMDVNDENQIINIKIEDKQGLSFNIINKDYEYQTGVAGTNFDAIVEELDSDGNIKNGIDKYTDISDASGNIAFDFFKTFKNENIRITLKEATQPTNYDSVEPIVINLTYNSNENIVDYSIENDISVAEITNNPDIDQSIDLTINHRKLDGLNVGITAMDSVTNADFVLGAKFTINESHKNSTVMTDETNADGMVTKTVGVKLHDETVTYTLKNVTGGEEYKKLAEDISFSVYFDKDGKIDRNSIKILAGADICKILDSGANSSSNDLELLISFIPKDKFYVDVVTVDEDSGDTLGNIPFKVTTSYNKEGNGTTDNEGKGSADVGYVGEDLVINYTVNTDDVNEKFSPLLNEQFAVKFDKDGYIQANGCTTSSKWIEFTEDTTGTRTVKLKFKLRPELALQIKTIDGFNNDIVIGNSTFDVSASAIFTSKIVTGSDGTAIGHVAPFGKGVTQEYVISESASNSSYNAIEEGRLFINFDAEGNIIGTPTTTIKNAKVEVIGQGEYSEPNIRITIQNEPKVKMTIESVEANTGEHVPLVGKYTLTEDKTGEVAEFNGEGFAYIGSYGTNEKKVYTVTQQEVPAGYTKHDSFKMEVQYDNDRKIVSVVRSNADDNNIILSAQDSNIPTNKWYTGNDKGAVEIKVKSYPILQFNISTICSNDNTPVENAIYTVDSSKGISCETSKSDSDGNIVVLAGETKEGITVYTIKQKKTILGYKDLDSSIEISANYDENGYLVVETKNPKVVIGNEFAEITGTTSKAINLTINYERLDGIGLGVECQNFFKPDQKVEGIGYKVNKVMLGSNNSILDATTIGSMTTDEYGLATMQLGEFQNATIIYEIQEIATNVKYEQVATNVIISVDYDAKGQITGTPKIIDGDKYVEITKCSPYYIRLTMKHYPRLLISFNTADRYDTENYLKASYNVTNYFIDPYKFSPGYKTLSDAAHIQTNGTDESVDAYLSGIRASNTRVYWFNAESAPNGYQPITEYMSFYTGYPYSGSGLAKYMGNIKVVYDANGDITSIEGNKKFKIEKVDDYHINVITTYTKLFTMTVKTNDEVTSMPIQRTYSLSPRACPTYLTTNANGIADYVWQGQEYGCSTHMEQGETLQNASKTYSLSEYVPGNRYINKGGVTFVVHFDEKGYISKITDTNGNDFSNGVTTSFEGMNAVINLDYSTEYKMNIKTADIYNNTKQVNAKYKITSSKGDVYYATGNTDVSVGKKYVGETVKYKIEQTQVDKSYILNSNDMYAYVTFLANGQQNVDIRGGATIKQDMSLNTNGEFKMDATVFNMQRFTLNIYLHDKLYKGSNIPNVKFKVTSNKNETAVNSVVTDANGLAEALIGKIYTDTTVEYTIEQLSTGAGYYANDTIMKVLVVYDSKGNVIESTLTQGGEVAEISSIPSGNRYVSIDVENQIKDINLGIETIDRLAEKGIENVNYKVKQTIEKVNDVQDFTFITKSNGEQKMKVDEYTGAKTVVYEIEQTSIEKSYSKLDGPIKFRVTYDDTSKIVGYAPLSEIPAGVTIVMPTTARPTLTSGEEADIKIKVETDNSYSIKFLNVDNRISTLPVEGSKFQCTVSSDSIDMRALPVISTDGFGIAKYINLIDEGNINIHFQQIAAGDGYKDNYNITGDIILNKSDNTISLVDSNVPEGIEVSLDVEKKQLSIKCSNETELRLKISRLEKGGVIQNAKIRLYQIELDQNGAPVDTTEIKSTTNTMTDVDGKLEYILGNSPINKMYKYQIQELDVPQGITKVPTAEITVVYDSNGMIKSIADNSTAVTCTEKPKLTLNTVIDSALASLENTENGVYKLNIVSVDSEDSEIRRGNQNYNIKITNEIGNDKEITQQIQTANNGEYCLDNINGFGNILITAEKLDENGQKKQDEQDATISLYRDPATYIIRANAATGVDYDVDSQSGTITLYIFAKEESGNYSIVLNNISRNDRQISDEFTYDVTLPDGSIQSVTSAENGVLVIPGLTMPTDPTTMEYKFKCTNKPSVCNQDENIQFNITLEFGYNSDRVLGIVNAILSDNAMVTINKLKPQLGKFNVRHDADDDLTVYDVKVVSQDADDPDWKIPGTELEIAIQNEIGDGSKKVSRVTDENGEATVTNINGYGNIVIDINKTGSDKIETVKLNRNQLTGIISGQDSTLEYEIDNATATITIHMLEETKEGKYSLAVNNLDVNTKEKIEDMFEYELTDPEGNSKMIATTKTGRIELRDIDKPAEEGTIKYVLKQYYVPTGYVLSEDAIDINIKFEKVDGVMQIVSADVGDSEIAKVEKQTERFVKVNVLNTNDPNQFGKYAVVINKVDATTKENIKDPTELQITLPNGEVKNYTTNKNGRVELLNIDRPQKEGTYLYEIREITAPKGYAVIEKPQILAVTFAKNTKTDVMEIKNSEIETGEHIEFGKSGTVNLIALNLLNEIDNSFDIKVVNVNKDDYGMVIPGVEFNVNVSEEDGTSIHESTATTDENGMITIENVDATGKLNVDIQETSNKVSGKLTLSRDQETGEITASDLTNVDYKVDKDNGIVYIYVLNDSHENEYNVIFANVDEYGSEIGENFEYEVISKGAEQMMTSNESGRIEFTGIQMPEQPGTIEYTLKPIYVPEKYVYNDAIIKVQVTFSNENGPMQIASAQVIDGENVIIDTATPHLVKFNITNKAVVDSTYSSGKYAIVINNKANLTASNLLTETKFAVTSPNGAVKNYTTNAKGRVEILNIEKPDKTGIYYYTIKQIENANGSEPIDEEQQIALTFTIVDNKMTITNVGLVKGNYLNIEPVKNANVIQLDFINKSENDLYLKTIDYEILDNFEAYAGNKNEFVGGDIYLNRIVNNTTYNDFISKLDTNATKVTIVNQKGAEISGEDYVGTGMIMTLEKEGCQDKIELMLVVTGDLTGNGKVGIVDTSRIESHYLNIKHLDEVTDNQMLVGAYMKAADINNNGKITIVDTSKMSSYYLKLTDVLYEKK